jgi:hypothetical protein
LWGTLRAGYWQALAGTTLIDSQYTSRTRLMEPMLKPPRREEFVKEAQQLLWSEIERWLVTHSDLSYTFYDCERDNANGRYHNYMVELLSDEKDSFGIRLHLAISKPEAVFRLGYWRNGDWGKSSCFL